MENKADAARIAARLKKLAAFSATARGVTRLPFTKEALKAASYLAAIMAQAGLRVYIDDSGAVHGIRDGQSKQRIVIGSHYDSVPEGGAFDGIAGVICGIELAELFRGKELKYGLEVVAFNDEEGVRFGDGFLSSKMLLGELDIEKMKARKDAQGISIYEALKNSGYNPVKIIEEKWNLDEIRAFFEIHVEQGAVLEQAQKQLGLVTGIVGMRRYKVEVTGQADHAGTTPMLMRHDALLPAAAAIIAAREAAMANKDSVATVGSLKVLPDAVNIVPEKVIFSLDLRSMQEEKLDAMEKLIMTRLNITAESTKTKVNVSTKLVSKPGYMDKKLLAYLQSSSKKAKASVLSMASGAGHDALPIAERLPAAMLFVPSKNGRSHCPEEWSDCQDLALAVAVLADTVLNMNTEE